MRKLIAFTLAATMIVGTSVRAEQPSEPEKRNPIEWLLNDLGDLFSNASKAMQTPSSETEPASGDESKQVVVEITKPTPEHTATSIAAPEQKRVPISDLFKDIAKLFDPANAVKEEAVHTDNSEVSDAESQVAVENPVINSEGRENVDAAGPEPEVAAQPTDAAAKRNPIAWLFSDLAKIFQPTLEIDQGDHAATGTTPDTEQVSVPEPVRQAADETETVPSTNADPAPAVEHADATDAVSGPSEGRSAIEWLLDDLARLADPAPAPEDVNEANGSDDLPAADLAIEVAEDTDPNVTEKLANVFKSDPAPEIEIAAPATEASEGLLTQLASIFSPSAPEAEVAAASAPATTGSPSGGDDETSAPPTASDSDALEAPASKPITVETREVETGPWTLKDDDQLFDPDIVAVDREARFEVITDTVEEPLQTQAAVSRAPAPEASESPQIRKREVIDPRARNHRRLGDPEMPPEEEQSVFAHFIENIFGIESDPKLDEIAAQETEQALAPAPKREPEPVKQETLANTISDRIVPEEKLDLGYTSPALGAPKGELETIGEGPLMDIDLYLGSATAVGTLYENGNHAANACLERPLHGSVFCVEPLSWPEEISSAFSLDTSFAHPGEGIVRYENGKLSRAYAVFEAVNFHDVVKFMQKRFGPPLEREIVWMHMIEAPKLPNTTFRWRAVTADRRDTVVLEVRNYDDLRRSFADLNKGMVRIYRNGSRPIFKHLSTVDLMLIQRRRVARAPVEVNAPPPQ